MNYGFITGLPRSGSAWIANYLSYGPGMVIHDAWKQCTPEALKTRFELEEGISLAGVSDPSNMLIFNQIDKVFPDAKWVLITRPQNEIEESCRNIDFPLADFTDSLQTLLIKKDVLKVPFAKLFDRADEIGRHIYPEWTSPTWRKGQLRSLNVQLHWGRVSDQFRVPETLREVDTLSPTKMEYHRLVKEICNNDMNAVRFLCQAREASELYRRLKEKKPVDIDKALETLEAMATEWLISPFIKNFAPTLAPAIMSCIEKYYNQRDLEHCPIDVDLLSVITYIFKGNDGVKEFMPKVRQLSDRILLEKTALRAGWDAHNPKDKA